MSLRRFLSYCLTLRQKRNRDIWDLEHNGGISQSFDPLFIENRSWVNNEVCERLFSGPGVSDQTTNSVVIPPYDRGDRWPGPPWSHQGRVICSFGCARQMLGQCLGGGSCGAIDCHPGLFCHRYIPLQTDQSRRINSKYLCYLQVNSIKLQ